MTTNATTTPSGKGGTADFLNSITDEPVKTETPPSKDNNLDKSKLVPKNSKPVEDETDDTDEEQVARSKESKNPTEFLEDLDEDETDDTEEDQPEQPKKEEKVDDTKYKVKIDGQEEEVTRDDMMKVYKSLDLEDVNEEPTLSQLKTIYKLVKSTNASKYRASEETKRAKAVFKRMEDDIWDVVEEFSKKKNIDVDAEIEKRLAKKLKLSMMSEEAREAFLKSEKDARDLDTYRKREEAEKKQREEEEMKTNVGKRAEEILSDINAAFESDKSLPRNNITLNMFGQLLKTAAQMYANRENPNVPANEKLQEIPKATQLVHLVKKQWQQHVNDMMTQVPDDSLIDALGEDHIKRIRKQDSKRLKQEQKAIPGVGKKPIVSEKNPRAKKKSESARDFFDSLKG